jgi:hypothetical protein
VSDCRRGDVVLDRALFREMRALGRWPLLFNVTTGELANLLPPGGEVARRLALHPPASGGRVLHLVPAALSDCHLSRDGIATPAVGPDILAARRLAQEAREAYRARIARPPPLAGGHTTPGMLPAVRPLAADSDYSDPGPSAGSVRAAVQAAGNVTTFAWLVRKLAIDSDRGEERLKSELYNLRLERVIDFDRPLGRLAASQPFAWSPPRKR